MSLSMEDATKAKQKEKQSKSKEKEQADWNKLPLLSQHVIHGLQARFAEDLDETSWKMWLSWMDQIDSC